MDIYHLFFLNLLKHDNLPKIDCRSESLSNRFSQDCSLVHVGVEVLFRAVQRNKLKKMNRFNIY
jgi:hypothetical protein